MSRKQKILLVDDDEIVAIVTAEVLSPEYEVNHVIDGQSALIYLSKEIPDLVLLDVDMPGMTGYDTCRAIRDTPPICNLPIIFLSGMDSEEDRLAGHDAGGNDYLRKPVQADELLVRVKLQLSRKSVRGH